MLKEIKRYQIRSHLGKGSMADVYEAYDPHTDRILAIKILREDRQENNEYLQRFFREAKAVGSLSHTNIVSIYDIDQIDARPFIVMEHLKGIPLSELIKSGRNFSFDEIITIGIQLALALDYAHGRGIIHRDIKPSNIIITSSNFKVKITDFGIAHFEDPEITMKTRMGDVLGTPQYMSPEQIQGTLIDGRSDLFSVGVILYQLVTGERPFTADTIPTLMYRITTMDPKPMTLGPEVPKAMRYIVHKLLEKKPESRYQSGKELAAALRQAQAKKNKEPRKLTNINDHEKSRPRKSIFKTFGIATAAIVIAFFTFLVAQQFINMEPNPGRIYGMVLSGNLKNTKIDIYKLGANGSSNNNSLEKITTTKTNDNGVFVAPLTIDSQPLMLVAQSPNGNKDQSLSSVVYYEEGQEIGANITLFSHAASALALYHISNGKSVNDAIDNANNTLSEFVQIDDILVSKVVEISENSARNPTDNDKYSIVQNGLYRLLKKNNQSGNDIDNVYSFAKLVFDDVTFDGKLNGVGNKGSLHFGARAFSTKYFREGLANTIMEMGKSFDAEFVLNDFYKIALLVNNNTSQLFDGEPGTQLRESPSAKLIAKQLDKIENIRKKFGKSSTDSKQSSQNNTKPARVASANVSNKAANTSKPKAAPTKNTVQQKPVDNTAGSNTSENVASSNTSLVRGTANLGGFLRGTTIKVSSLNSAGKPTKVLASAKTDNAGQFEIPINIRDRNQIVMVAAYGGHYKELITNKTVRLKAKKPAVSAIIQISRNSETVVNLTFFTHATAALTQNLIKKGKSAKNARQLAYSRMKNIVGFEFQKTVPATKFTTSEHNGLITPELAYGMYNAAISNLALDLSHIYEVPPHIKYTSAAFANIAYNDIYYDGLLNGVDTQGGVFFGKESVSVELYRRHLAESLLSIAQSNINNTGLKFDQFFTIASNYNESTDEIFANEPAISINSEGPLITKLNPGKESALSGIVNLSASVTDVTGIEKATFWLGKTYLGNAKNPISPSLSFNSRRFPSGSHRLKISVLNKEGKESTLTHFVYVNNKVKKKTSFNTSKK